MKKIQEKCKIKNKITNEIENESSTSDLVTVVVVTDFILESGGCLVDEVLSFLLRDELESVIFGLEGTFWGFDLILTVVLLVSAMLFNQPNLTLLISSTMDLILFCDDI